MRGPGKSAPLLLQQLAHYRPGSDLLAQPTPQLPAATELNAHAEQKQQKVELTLSEHVHRFVADRKPETGIAADSVAFVCAFCRYHFALQVTNGEGDCGSSATAIHHFIATSHAIDHYQFKCNICSTDLTVRVHPPRLSDEIMATFDPEVVKARFDAFESDPPLTPTPTPANYALLYRILHDTLTLPPTDPPRSIRVQNTAINTKLDQNILPHFGFTKDESAGVWRPPELIDDSDKSLELRSLLTEACMELTVLQNEYASELSIAEQLLKCANYPKFPRVAYIDLTTPSALRCASLGALPDFSDDLLLQTFERQTACDPNNAAYYLECLRELSTSRQSEQLQIRVVELQSLGALTRDDLKNAYAELGVDHTADDSLIIGTYKARLQDSPASGSKMKAALRVIADSTDSSAIRTFLQAESLDEQSSYSALGIARETDDDIVMAAYDMNVQDNPDKSDLYRNALLVIARTRGTPTLLSEVEKRGLVRAKAMSTDAAYGMLGVLSTMEDSHILAVYQIRVADTPDDVFVLRQGLRVIANARNSLMLKHFLDTGIVDVSIEPQGNANEPVGLWNIGNTCYLNSLLQYYFTIKPLRDLILSFNADMAAATTDIKRIGGRKVTEWEINRGQEFVRELAHLFNHMIASTESSVAPRPELAYLTLVSSKEAFDRMAVSEPEGEKSDSLTYGPPTRDEAEAIQSNAPLDIDSSRTEASDIQADDLKVSQEGDLTKVDQGESETSDIQIEDIDVDEDVQSDVEIVDISDDDLKENISPVHEEKLVSATSNRHVLGEITTNRDPAFGSKQKEPAQDKPEPEQTNTHAPALPPRSQAQNTASNQSDGMMFGSQQDVTECIENVLFQIEAALKPERTDSDGEQIDLIKDLFYGKTNQTLEIVNSGDIELRVKEERFSHLIVDVASGPRDIYDALDAYFDVEVVDLDGRPATRYVTLSQLPPILQVQVQRVQYDRERGRVFKSNAPLKFDRTIYLDRYMESDDLKERRRQVSEWKAELKKLETQKAAFTAVLDHRNKLTAAETLATTRDWLIQVREATTGITAAVDVDIPLSAHQTLLERQDGLGEGAEDVEANAMLSELISELTAEVDSAVQDMPQIDSAIRNLQANISSQYVDLNKLGYHVHAVFIHQGQANFGHYWIYIYDFMSKKFRKYNDKRVSDVSDDEVMPFAAESELSSSFDNGAATPYFLVFVRDNLTGDLIETVKRSLPEPGLPECEGKEQDKDDSEDGDKRLGISEG